MAHTRPRAAQTARAGCCCRALIKLCCPPCLLVFVCGVWRAGKRVVCVSMSHVERCLARDRARLPLSLSAPLTRKPALVHTTHNAPSQHSHRNWLKLTRTKPVRPGSNALNVAVALRRKSVSARNSASPSCPLRVGSKRWNTTCSAGRSRL